eukprot:3941787-Rhodomonas_salina.1
MKGGGRPAKEAMRERCLFLSRPHPFSRDSEHSARVSAPNFVAKRRRRRTVSQRHSAQPIAANATADAQYDERLPRGQAG